MRVLTFYDDPITCNRIGFNSERKVVAFITKDLIDDDNVREKLCSPRGFPIFDWKAGRVIGDYSFLPYETLQKIAEDRGNELIFAHITSERIILNAVRYRYLREVIGADESGIFIPCGNSRVFPKVTDAAIDSLIARRVG